MWGCLIKIIASALLQTLYCALPFLVFTLTAAHAAVSVMDDSGQKVTLAKPAQRIISLAPHTTELLFAAGAGQKIVAVSDYSNYPPSAQKLPSVGGSSALDLERIIALRPDLIVMWQSGNTLNQITTLKKLGIPFFNSEPRTFSTIASSLERLGKLAGTEATASATAHIFRQQLKTLTETYQKTYQTTYQHPPPVSVFYQVGAQPLMTLNGKHLVSAAIRLCGGRNIFSALPQLAATISLEAVLQANPEVILTGKNKEDIEFSDWSRFPELTAVRQRNLFSIPGDLLLRPGPRIIQGTTLLCSYLETARQRRLAKPAVGK